MKSGVKRKVTKGQAVVVVVLWFIFLWLAVSVLICGSFRLVMTALDAKVSPTKEQLMEAVRHVGLLSLTLCTLNLIRRRIFTDRPSERINESLQKITKGDFSVRIKPAPALFNISALNPLIDSINRMTEELSGVETLRTDFIANVSHELKTPLSVISNYSVLLQAPDLSDAQRIEYAQAIAQTSRRLAALISNILKLNQLENQTIYPSATHYSLSEQLCEVLLQYEQFWEKKQINLVTEIEEDVFIHGDAELLAMVWSNLFSNALKFTDPGGTVTVVLRRQGERIAVSVGDTGCGMDEETKAHMFEKFYQGDPSRATQGNGLGLALVKRIADVTRCTLDVQSFPDVGTTVTVLVNTD